MENMFFACRAFNQPLNNWDVRNLTNDDDMFEDCIISDENMPIFQEVNEVNRIKVDPLQMHKEAFKTNYEKLSDFFKEKLNNIDVPDNIVYSTYINDTLLNIIYNHYNDDNVERNMKIEGLERIMNERLNSLNYREQSNVLLKCIFYTLEYVKTQPTEFKKIYVDTFIKECVTAYEGPDGMTCALGALERVVRSLVNPCTTILSKGEENDDYETIIAIIVRDPVKLIPEYIRDWYKLHKIGTDGKFSDELTEQDRKENLRTYLLGFFPDEGVLIEEKIVEIADNIGYSNDDFTYGGRKKKMRKSNESKKNLKNLKNLKNKKSLKRHYNKSNKNKKSLKRQYNKSNKNKKSLKRQYNRTRKTRK
jgi:hypothetical protein